MRLTFLLLVLHFVLHIFVRGQDTLSPRTDLSDLSIEELIDIEVYVAGRRYEKIIQSPSIVSVATREDIVKWGAVTLVDVLKFLPGIEISLDSKGEYNIAVRGIQKAGNTLLLVNGQSINDFYSGQPVFDLSADFIERVEIVRGPGSALYGTNAMVSVINVTTINDNSVSVAYGLNNLVSFNAVTSMEKENVEFNAFVGYQQNNTAQSKLKEDAAQGESWNLTSNDRQYTTDRWNNDINTGMNLKVQDFKFSMFNLFRQRGAYVGPLFIAAPDSKITQNRMNTSMLYDFRISDNVIVTPKVYVNSYYNFNTYQEAPDGFISDKSGEIFENGKISREEYYGVTYGSELDFRIKASDQFEILSGAVFEDVRMYKYNLDRNYNSITEQHFDNFSNYNNLEFHQKDQKRFVFAYFLQGRYEIAKFIFHSGLRFDDYSDFGQSFNPRLGVTYNITSRLRLKGLYGKAFRAPTFLELYDNTLIGNDIGVKGNENLLPETINTAEIAFEYNLKNVYLKYNAYYIKNSSLIRIYDPYGGGGAGVYKNIGDVNYFGQEIEGIFHIFKGLAVNANYSHFMNRFYWDQDNVNKADVIYLSKRENFSRELRNIPTMRINAGLSYRLSKIKFFVGGNFGNPSEQNNRFYLERTHFANIPYYVSLNSNIVYKPINKVMIQLIVNNIGTKYSAPDESTNIDAFGEKGLIQPGITALLKLNYIFH